MHDMHAVTRMMLHTCTVNNEDTECQLLCCCHYICKLLCNTHQLTIHARCHAPSPQIVLFKIIARFNYELCNNSQSLGQLYLMRPLCDAFGRVNCLSSSLAF